MPLRELPVAYPGAAQFGLRWNHIGRGFEYSLSFFDGLQSPAALRRAVAAVSGRDHRVRAHLPAPAHVRRRRGRAASLGHGQRRGRVFHLRPRGPRTSTCCTSLQLERQAGEWVFVGGYAGEAVTTRRSTARVRARPRPHPGVAGASGVHDRPQPQRGRSKRPFARTATACG